MRLSLLAIIVLSLLLSWNLAAAGWQKNGFHAVETDWSKSEDGFAAALLLSAEPEKVLRGWSTPGVDTPVRTAETVPRGVPVVAFVIFSGCAAAEDGMCDAAVDFTILEPDGSEYDRFDDRDLWKRKPAPPEGMLRLSAEYVGVIVEPGDPLGEYTFLVTVRDLNTGTVLELSRTFTAIE